MILRIENLQDACNKILPAVDNQGVATSDIGRNLSDKLQLSASNGNLNMCVTNGEYFAKVSIAIDDGASIFATVKADLFLKLISQTTSESVELLTDGNNLVVKGNGEYKIPLIFNGDSILELSEIKINNVTNEFSIGSDVLNSVVTFNSKSVAKEGTDLPQKTMYYIDDMGCITYTSGACVNNFRLSSPVRMLLPSKIVKLFKLFKEGNVSFKIGYDEIATGIVQTKVEFYNDSVCITAILSCDDALMTKVPASAIRDRATKVYPYSVSLNKNDVIQMINRLSIFATSGNLMKPYGKFEFSNDYVTVYDWDMRNKEIIYYDDGELSIDDTVKLSLDLAQFKSTVESCSEQNITLSFGDGEAVVVTRGNIKNIIPEIDIR